MKFKLIIGCLLLCCSISFGARPVVKLQRGDTGYTFEFELPDWQTDNVDTLGRAVYTGYKAETYTRIRVPDYKYTDEVGKSKLPVLIFYMALPSPDLVPTFDVVQPVEEFITLSKLVFPAQKPWPKSQSVEERTFSIDKSYYSSKGEKEPLARVDEKFTIRGVPCVKVVITPFAYNPTENKFAITKKVTLKINTSTATKYTGLDSKAFEKYLRYILVNFDDAVEPVKDRNRNDDYHIITAPTFDSDLSDFVSFRESRFNVTMVTTGTTGTSASQIESYIKNLSPTPTFLLLVGDVGDIPTGGSSCDLDYSNTEGDYHPEILLGRFSVGNSTDLSNVIRKTIFMETNLNTIEKKNIFIGGADAGSGGIAEGTHNYCIDTYLDDAGYENTRYYCNSSSVSESDVTASINGGLIFNVYSGHGSSGSWGAGDFSLSTSDVQNLTNTTSYPFMYGFACNTGSYSSSECFTEGTIRAENGGVICVGSTVSSYWGGDDEIQRGMFDAIFDANNPQTSVAASLNAGKLNEGSESYHKQYNLMGDPGLEVFPVMLDPYIGVKIPNGGEEWEQYTTKKITWNDNIDGNVKIELLKGGSVVETIASSVVSEGSYEWNIPENLEIGDEYKIKVTSIDSAALIDESDENFSIVEEYIINEFPYVQDFDALDTGLGMPLPEKWEQLAEDDIDWIVFSGPTPSRIGSSPDVTGPMGDHTSGNGNYIYIEASDDNNPDKRADYITPKFNFSTLSKPQLIFWCHMLSDSNHMGDLYLDISVDGTWHSDVIHLTDDYGDAWFSQTVDLSQYSGDRVRFRFRGVTGESWASDIGIDDYIITSAPEFTSGPDTVASVNAEYSYDVTASDEDDDGSGLTIASTTVPSWLDLTDNGNGTATLSGTPQSDDAGEHEVVLTLTDGLIPEPVEQPFTIFVSTVPPPVITDDPDDVTVTEGETANFTVSATGEQVGYQWQKNEVDISGATEDSYTTPPTVGSDNGAQFRCIVSNPGGNVASASATLTVILKIPVVTVDPKDVTVNEIQTATFSVSATGSELSYQWQKDGEDIIGATNSTYTTPPTVLADNNSKFRCIISNPAGSITSGAATLTVLPFTAIKGPDNVDSDAHGLFVLPNPADNNCTMIRFSFDISGISEGQLAVYDALGNRVFEEEFPAGQKGESVWDLTNSSGKRVAGGMYVAVLWLTDDNGTIRQLITNIGVKGE